MNLPDSCPKGNVRNVKNGKGGVGGKFGGL